jgi:phosphatidylglycerophosphate synthase
MKKSINLSFNEVLEKSKRRNDSANNSLHWFSSKFSKYISYVLIKIGVSADQATILFFLIGLIGALLFMSVSPILTLLGYVLWRLHIIIDMCDGDIARFNSSFSIRGAYWDAVIHSVLNPLYNILICVSFYVQFDNNLFLFLSSFLGMSSSLLLSVKNNYYKAMLHNNIPYNRSSVEKKLVMTGLSKIKYKITYILSEILSIEGFLLLSVVVRFVGIESYALNLILLFMVFNCAIACVKFYSLSYKGKTFTKA